MTSLPFSPPPTRSLLVPGALLAAALLAAIVAQAGTFVAAAAIGITGGAALVLGAGTSVTTVFRWGLLGLLVGYAFLGRGFAHLGVPPVFVGELVLGLAALSLFVQGIRHRWSGVEWLVLAFMLWGALQTLPYVGQYGVDAFRDAAFWGYAVFALVAAAHLRTRSAFDGAIRIYALLIPVFLLWVPMFRIASSFVDFSLARTGVPLLAFKGGDMAVHLAAVAAFILLGLYGTRRRLVPVDLLWVVWFTGAASLLSGRAALLTLMAGLGATAFLRPNWRFASFLWVGAVIVAAAVMLNLSISPGSGPGVREISATQVVTNIRSIFTDTDQRNNSTRDWRLEWWGEIAGYTFGGDDFWTGRGFGINLAEEDGFGTIAGDLRSPHSSHLTVLARMGVPGLALWIALHSIFALTMLANIRRAQARGDHHWQSILTWILVYWAAALVNASFDVYLEGPQGAIWFWSVFGAGIAAMRVYATERSHAPVRPTLRGLSSPLSAGS